MAYFTPAWVPANKNQYRTQLRKLRGMKTPELVQLKTDLLGWEAEETAAMIAAGWPRGFDHDWAQSSGPIADRGVDFWVYKLLNEIDSEVHRRHYL